jgi:hypothetical protein
MNEVVNSEIVMLIRIFTNLNPCLFYFSSWLPENFSDADSNRQEKEQPESEASLGCGG